MKFLTPSLSDVSQAAGIFVNNPLKEMTYFCYLPSAHVLDQEVFYACVCSGGKIAFISAGISSLVDDLKYSKPSFLIAVPRVLQKIYEKFNETMSQAGYIANAIYNTAYYYKRNAVINNSWNYIDWDYWVFNKIHEIYGGKLQIIMNGGAPLTPDLYEWLRVTSGAVVLQGYGLTETFGGLCSSLPGMTDLNVLNVGSVCPTVSVRLVSVPEMNYTVDDDLPSGEIQIKADQNFKEYYKQPELTQQAFTEDGYFCTGDIGRVCPDGSLSIIDRKKNLFKLAQGEYIAVEPLENKYCDVPLVSQIFIYGESSDVFIVGIIVPELPELKRILIELNKINESTTKEEIFKISNELETRKQILTTIINKVKGMNVPHYELIKNVYFESEGFSTENDLMTPSFKLKRIPLKKKYGNILKELREEVYNGTI